MHDAGTVLWMHFTLGEQFKVLKLIRRYYSLRMGVGMRARGIANSVIDSKCNCFLCFLFLVSPTWTISKMLTEYHASFYKGSFNRLLQSCYISTSV